VNKAAPRPNSMPPLGSITHSRTQPARIAGATAAISDHTTLPLPDPVAPAIKMCWPDTGNRHHRPASVKPTPTA